MKSLIVLLKREWLEWRKVVLGTIAVITFMNLLMLLTVARGSHWVHEKLERDGHITLDNTSTEDGGSKDVDLRMNGNELEIYIEGEPGSKQAEAWLSKATLPIVFGTRLGMMMTFGFVLFLSLFYFSDALYKERADNSTLFYRSLPISDHLLLLSKVLAGLVGVIALTLLLSIEYLIFIRIALAITGEPLNSLAGLVMSQISYVGVIWDWFSYLIFAAIRVAPLALFLMLVGAYVKGRPLLIGIGGPLLFAISWAIVFRSTALLSAIGRFFWGFNQMLIDQWEIMEQGLDHGVAIYGNFWNYVFNLESLLSLLVSTLLYYALVWTYRKNLPTG